MDTYTYIIDAISHGARLDQVVTAQLKNHSRSYCKELIVSDCVVVNGTVVGRPSTPVKTGDRIEITFPEVRPLGALPLPAEDMGVRVVYEHEDFLIIYKPAGLVMHAPHAKSTQVTLVDWLVHTFAELRSVGFSDRPGIVHRLDKDTSGIVVVPRNDRSHRYFAQLFQDRTIEKTYQAIVSGHPQKEGTCDEPIGRDRIYRHKMAVTQQGKDAFTRYEVADYFGEYSLLNLYPKTGRTHQIRVHCAALGYPLLGDTTYGTASQKIDRQALHAYQLSFTYDNRWYSFMYSMPQDMRSLCKDQTARSSD